MFDSVRAGFGRHDITAWEPEMAMMGWGRMDNRIVGVETPLHARAMVLEQDDTLIAYCCVELMAVSLAIRSRVLARLQDIDPRLDEHHVMLTATHTHSGPSGYSHYFFLNLNGPGYSPRVLDAAVDGIVAAVCAAIDRLEPANLRVGDIEVPLDDPIVFNRSWFAYNLNEDVEPVTRERRDEALERRMTALAVDNANGEPLGSVTWFPVHCTTVHSENDRLHHDNKGVASRCLEEEQGGDYVAIFAQEASGDVTPNFRYDSARKKVVGKLDNDYESAEFHGARQAHYARRALAAATAVDVSLRGATHYVDFSQVDVAEAHSGVSGARTTIGTLGVSMAEGTDEGPGPILGLRPVMRRLTRLKKRLRDPSDPKIPMLDVGNGLDAKFVGLFGVTTVPPVDETFRYVRRVVRDGAMENHAWIPQVLPLQLLQIGPLLLIGQPWEASTVAGRRIRAHASKVFGVERPIVANYANTYAGYLTTFEEYQLQHYEGAYTLFGPHQLAATLTMLDWMADRWGREMPLGATPPQFSEACLHSRLFTPWTMPRAERPW